MPIKPVELETLFHARGSWWGPPSPLTRKGQLFKIVSASGSMVDRWGASHPIGVVMFTSGGE
jgi:hypothetical protein